MNHRLVFHKEVTILFIFLISFGQSFGQVSNNDSLLSIVKSLPKDTNKVKIFNAIAQEASRSNPKVCFNYASQALELSIQLGYKKGRAISRENLGFYYTATDQYLKASIEYEKALECYNKINDLRGVSKTLNKIGVIYQLQTDYYTALDYYLQVLELEKESGDEIMLATIYGNLGNLYDQLNDSDTAQEYYEKALNIFIRNHDEAHIAGVYGNIGLMHLNDGKFDTALHYFNSAAVIDSTLGNTSALSNDFANLALLYKKMKKFHESKKTYEKAINLDRELNNMLGIASDLDGLSGLYLSICKDSAFCSNQKESISYKEYKTTNLKKALELGLQSQKLHEELNSRDFEIYSTLKNIYIELGDYKKALEYANLYWDVRNQIFSAKKAREFTRLEAKQGLELNQKKIELLEIEGSRNFILIVSLSVSSILLIVIIFLFVFLLRQNRAKNKELAILNQELNKANKSKDKFFSILAHDLISTVGSVSEALKILNRDSHKLSEKEKAEFINVVAESSAKAYDLLKGLLEWSRLRQNQIEYQPKLQDLSLLIQSNINQLMPLAKAKEIKIKYNNPTPMNASFDGYMMNSVLSNLLSNAIKFTPNKGSISLRVKANEAFVEVEIEDNGIGIKEDKLESIFDIGTHHVTIGTNNEKGTGLGLSLCLEFMEIHKGKITVESVYGKGSTFSIYLPIQSA